MGQGSEQGLQQPPPHGIGGAIEEDLHLQVVKLCGAITQVAIGLMVKVLEVVVGKLPRIHVPWQVSHIPATAATPDGRLIQPHQGVAQKPIQPGAIKEQLAGVEALLGFVPVEL